MNTMRANVFEGVNRFGIQEIQRPCVGVGQAVIRVTLTTICGTDLHIVRGEYPVKPVWSSVTSLSVSSRNSGPA